MLPDGTVDVGTIFRQRFEAMMELKDYERGMIDCIAGALPEEERQALERDLRLADVNHRSDDGRIVQFALAGYSRPEYRGQDPYSVEVTFRNRSGSHLYVMLYKDQNGRLLELEIIPVDDAAEISPDLRSATIHTLRPNSP